MRLDPEQFASVVVGTIKSALKPITERLAALEQRQVRDGKDGEPGPQGPAGEKGLTGERGDFGPQGPQGERGEAGPQGPEGREGPAGPSGEKGLDGAPGRDGRDGQPGSPGPIGEKGIDGTNGRDGIDGKDGLGFDDFDERLDDDGRTIIRTYRCGDRVKEFRHKFATVLYRGLYDATKSYEQGDAVTWGGSMWIARDTVQSIAPDENSPAGKKSWALSVQRGRQGKEGRKGDVGERGPRGEMGPRGQQGYGS